jgi:S-adenosylmethionine/arginine decarboxylase-like enzyme
LAEIKFNPVEKNMFVALYGINIIKNNNLSKQFSVANVEKIIVESGANIDGKLSDLSMRDAEIKSPRDVIRKRYIAMLSESTAATSIFPNQRYASFLLSTCGEPDPLKALDPLINLFDPVKVEIRYFTSSPIIDSKDADEDAFWERFDDQKIPFFYTLKSKQKDVKGIYCDLISDRHDPLPIKTSQDSPVEKNMLVSLYDVDLDVLREFSKAHGIPMLENVIEASNLKVTGRMSKEFDALDGSEIKGFSYVGQLDNGSAAYHITPESSYVSFFISGSGESIPFKSLEPLILLFKPKKAEVRYFGSSQIDKIHEVPYNNSKSFWEELDKHELPEGYSLTNKEKLTHELYFDLVKD